MNPNQSMLGQAYAVGAGGPTPQERLSQTLSNHTQAEVIIRAIEEKLFGTQSNATSPSEMPRPSLSGISAFAVETMEQSGRLVDLLQSINSRL